MPKTKRMVCRILVFTLALSLGFGLAAATMTAYANEADDIERSVKAHDIVKDISDPDFAVETCMEGIECSEAKATVTLSAISDKAGNAYDPQIPGIYIAEYFVVPKNGTEVYFISRKIILTDTKGLAKNETDSGEAQKYETEENETLEKTESLTSVIIQSSVGVDKLNSWQKILKLVMLYYFQQ